MTIDIHRATYDVRGIVQGVGFRPALYRLAFAAGLGGTVQNRASSVRLVLEAPERGSIKQFLDQLQQKLPPHARVDSVTVVSEETVHDPDWIGRFTVLESQAETGHDVSIPADLAMCDDCRDEVLDPSERRHGYPFTTCTNCGPRYTVIHGMPYDRERTTMAQFPMCAACRREYSDPADRRYHAETIACDVCGPRLQLGGKDGRAQSGDALRGARRALADGRIVAIRGIGGYLLAADALNRNALETLRLRKTRPHKPLAVMAPDLATAQRFCRIGAEAGALLQSPQAPIVICDARMDAVAEADLPLDLISPDTATLGIMLPTSPLHMLLFMPLRGDTTPAFDLLIMTSGNHGGEPICIGNGEAYARLGGIADVFLEHDREINLRNDDSIYAVQRGRGQVWRRARGLAPGALVLPRSLKRCVLAMGAEIKNAIAFGYDNRVVVSPHIGDLETPEAVDGLRTVSRTLPAFLGREPETVVVDLHPDMHCTRLGMEIAGQKGLPLVQVQHHHAHALACLVEHGVDSGLALVFDGTGLGPDGTIWGAELLEVEGGLFKRLASFESVPLPGGDAAVRRPARQLIGRLAAAGIDVPDHCLEGIGATVEEASIWTQQCRQGLNAPLTHAAGRVYDAFAAMVGVAPGVVTYEGQAAIRLEAAAARCGGPTVAEVPFAMAERDGMLWIDWSEAFSRFTERRDRREDQAALALGFHRAVAAAAKAMIVYGLSRSVHRRIALSGGVFMNRILTGLVSEEIDLLGMQLLLHRATPPNDGCIAIGQVAAAAGRPTTFETEM